MRAAYGWVMCVLFLVGLSVSAASAAIPERNSSATRNAWPEADLFHSDQSLFPEEFFAGFRFWWRRKPESPSPSSSIRYARRTEDLLYEAVIGRLGTPYRYGGIDDRGYDCSGFVWRVCQEAGINFERMSTRDLWMILPEASPEDRDAFGTLVFFQNLSHVGIVRNEYSFYHASSSQGVVESPFDGYWSGRIIGYRRALPPVEKRGRKIRPRL